jgi:hypothetical protein
MGGWLRDLLAVYRLAFGRGIGLAIRNPVLIVPALACLYARVLLPSFLAPLGLAGGLVFILVESTCWSAMLACTGEVVRTGRVGMDDVRAGFTAHLGDVLNVRFALWLLALGLSALQILPLTLVVGIAVSVFLNAVPELIYLGRYGTADLLAASYRFIGENWIEWFPATLFMVVVAGGVLGMVNDVPGVLGEVLLVLTLGALLGVGLTVRGVLFLELGESGRRARAFRRSTS